MVMNHSESHHFSEIIMLIDVVKVFPKEDFQLDLVYANGEQRRFDMKPLLSELLSACAEYAPRSVPAPVLRQGPSCTCISLGPTRDQRPFHRKRDGQGAPLFDPARLLRLILRGIGAHQHHSESGRRFLDHLQRLDAVYPGHLEIHQHAIKAFPPHHIHRLLAAVGPMGVMPLDPQDRGLAQSY